MTNKPTYKKWLYSGLFLYLTALALVLYLLMASKDGQMPTIYNYAPEWIGIFYVPLIIIGGILSAIGMRKRRNYRIENKLPLFRPYFQFLLMAIVLTALFGGGYYYLLHLLAGVPSSAEAVARTNEVAGYLFGGLGGLTLALFLQMVFAKFRIYIQHDN